MRYLLAPALTLALCVPAFAAFDGPTAPGPAAGGFQGPASTRSCLSFHRGPGVAGSRRRLLRA